MLHSVVDIFMYKGRVLGEFDIKNGLLGTWKSTKIVWKAEELQPIINYNVCFSSICYLFANEI
jgi:hypothetical protein